MKERSGAQGSSRATEPWSGAEPRLKKGLQMFVTKMSLPRRTVLRGLGATLALPLLDAMVPALSAMSRTAANPVRRLGVVYTPNGMAMEYWTPAAEGAAFEPSIIMQPLTP